MKARGRSLRGALLALALAACAGLPRLDLVELPDAPLAVVYLEPEPARRRAERLQQLRGESRQRDTDEAGILQLDELRRVGAGEAGLPVGRLALLDPRSARVRVLEAAPRGAFPLDWSADRETLLFAAQRLGPRQLFTLHLPSGDVRPVTDGPRPHPLGCLLPDGRVVAVEQGARQGRPVARLVVAARGGRDPQPLTPGPWDIHPSCAPDGRHVAYTTLRGRGLAVAVVALDGEGEPRVLGPGSEPSFTPDGAWIVYSATTSRGPRLWRARPDGSGKRALGASTLPEADPAVSPDGGYVVYVSEENARRGLRVRRMDGSGDRPFFSDGDAAAPVW